MSKKIILATAIVAILSGCGVDKVDVPNQQATWLPDNAPNALSQTQIDALATRAAFGLTAVQKAQIAQQGYISWLDAQFNAPLKSQYQAYQSAKSTLPLPLAPEQGCTFVRGGDQDIRDGVWWTTVLQDEQILRHRAAYALSQIFVVSKKYSSINARNPQTLAAYYDILQQHAFGNFRDLLTDVTLSPSMGAFLSLVNSKKHNPKRGTFPDENYAREVMQLFTIGLYELNLDGTAKRDDNGELINTYSQTDVQEVARALSGWTYSDKPENVDGKPVFGKGYMAPMTPASDRFGSLHDEDEKIILGHTLPAGQTPEEDLHAVLDILFDHPNTAPFISRQLIQRMVTSNPSPAYIERVAKVFNDNGDGVRGDLKRVFAAVLLDPEALVGSSDPKYPTVKLKEPVMAVAEALRLLGGTVNGEYALGAAVVFNHITQGILNSETVFNFYAPDFMPSGDLLDNQLLAPEFEIMGWANLISYHNLIRNYVIRALNGVRCDNSVTLDLNEYVQAASSESPDELAELLNQRLLNGKMSEALKQAIVNGAATEKQPNNKVQLAISLTVTSPEFLIQR